MRPRHVDRKVLAKAGAVLLLLCAPRVLRVEAQSVTLNTDARQRRMSEAGAARRGGRVTRK